MELNIILQLFVIEILGGRNFMQKKLLGIFICTLLIATALPVMGLTEKIGNQNFNATLVDELDQQSTKTDSAKAVGPSDEELAQSFTPTLPVLTRVILRLKSTGTPEFYYYYVDIKSTYGGSALTTAHISRDEFIVGTGFYEFDFPDISVTPGSKYYIILRGVSDSPDLSSVYWWYGYPDPYAGGDAWYEHPAAGWNYLQEGIVRCDYVFQTYGTEANNPPYAPAQPSGHTSGVVGESYFYTTSAIDPDGDKIKYGWDWDGDGITDEYSNLMNSGNVDSRNHAWTSAGTYNVKVKAQDEHGLLSGFSSALSVIISEANDPPDKPDTPSGATSGKSGTSYSYSTSTTDPEDDQVYYWFDWGDGSNSGWNGPHDSGDVVSLSHVWSEDGTYPLKVKSKDTNGAESIWSDPLSVTMPKSRVIQMPLLKLLKQYLILYQFLQRFIQL